MPQYLVKIVLFFFLMFPFLQYANQDNQVKIQGIKIVICKGDITRDVDAIVNAANQTLTRGGGVCGAIFAKAGNLLVRECDAIIKKIKGHNVSVGHSVITSGGNLKQHIIHVVSPNFNPNNCMQKSIPFNSDGKKLLVKSYENALKLAKKEAIKAVAIPFLSGGNFCRRSSDKKELAKIARDSVVNFCNKNIKNGILKKIKFVLYSDSDFNLFIKTFKTL